MLKSISFLSLRKSNNKNFGSYFSWYFPLNQPSSPGAHYNLYTHLHSQLVPCVWTDPWTTEIDSWPFWSRSTPSLVSAKAVMAARKTRDYHVRCSGILARLSPLETERQCCHQVRPARVKKDCEWNLDQVWSQTPPLGLFIATKTKPEWRQFHIKSYHN